MRMIISPAKKMRVDTDSLLYRDLPAFLPRTEELVRTLQSMSDAQLKKLWKCNDQIAGLNISRLQNMDLHNRLTPAVLAYEAFSISIWLRGYSRSKPMTTFRSSCGFYPGFMAF